MKTFIYRCTALLIIFTSTLLSHTEINFTEEEKKHIKQNPELTITVANSFRPFSYRIRNKNLGYTNGLIKEIEKVSGLKFSIKYSKWQDIFNKLEKKETNIIANISRLPKRDKFLLFTKSYYNIPHYVFGLKKHKNTNTLKNKTLAVKYGYYQQDRLKKDGIKIFNVDSSIKKTKAVLDAKADYFLASYLMEKDIIDENIFTPINVEKEFSYILKEDLRFALRKDDKILRSILDKSLSKIPKDTYKKLEEKWIDTYYDKNQKIKFTKEESNFIKKNPVITYSEVDWKPLSIIENNTMKGIIRDHLDYISSISGLKFKFIPSKTWKEVLDKFTDGKIDLIPGGTLEIKEKTQGLMSDIYEEYPLVIVTGNKYRYLNNLWELKDKIVTVPKYYSSYFLLKNNYPNIKLLITNNVEESLLLVEEGKADAFVGHIAVSLYYISELGLENLKIAGTTNFTLQHSNLINKNKPILKSIINKSLRSMSEEKKETIYYNWIQPIILKKQTDYTLLFIAISIFLLILIVIIYKQSILKKSYKDIENIINLMIESLLVIENGKCINVNNSAVKLFKYNSKKEMVNQDLSKLIDEKYINMIEDKNNINPTEIEIITSDNINIQALIKISNLKLSFKKVKLISLVDISEIKNKEELLIEQSKMAALGEMIGHIAHQWRQPLSLVTSILTSWKIYGKSDTFLEKEKILSDTDIILANANYLSQTIDDFRSFTKTESLNLEYNIKDLIDSLLKLTNPSIKDKKINLILENKLDKKVKGNQNEILQALINIINNAIDALSEKEGLKLIFINTYDFEDKIKIEIKDNAGGINKKIKKKIFEPYFTTKHESKGIGLGLYIVYSIIEKLQYNIEVENEEYLYENQKQIGAKFIISIPPLS
ncbi:MAG: transporter substrate-binding domain-containing protein [Arcobacter sp.]|nr:transporter substrate-binding domain-containing protein [Arcobacter sp.]